MENPNVGPIQEPGVSRIPPNSNLEPIPNPHQLGGGGKRYDRSRVHELVHGQAVFGRGPFGVGQEGDLGLEPQAELLLLKIPPQTIQEGGNTNESQKYQKTPSLCHLII